MRLNLIVFLLIGLSLGTKSHGLTIIPPLQNTLNVKGKFNKCHGSDIYLLIKQAERIWSELNRLVNCVRSFSLIEYKMNKKSSQFIK